MSWLPEIKIVKGDVHRQYLARVYQHAAKYSEDPATKTAAMLVSPSLDEILACGANHFPKGVIPTEEQRHDKKWKYEHIVHGERAVIYAAARKGKKTENAVMYVPWIPCTPCAIAVIDAGVKKLIGHLDLILMTPERWQATIAYGIQLLQQGDIECCVYQGKIGGVQNLFNEHIWEP